MSFNIGDMVGDYQVMGVLGAGGMGKVYKVRNTISDRVEAMKVLLPNLAQEPELADRFIREIKLLASLDHPNIASLHTASRVQNQLLMFMEYVEGATLDEKLRQGPLPVAEAVECIDQALVALQYAHERGVIHRDIKPANMMLAPGGAVKLMDFGIAKAAADRRLTMTGTTLGSLYYMSPEQIKGSLQLDGRADLYSVGVSLYELVTGQRPFKGDSDYAIMAAHLEQEPLPPIQVDPRLPQVLNDLILTAIQKDPAKRFQTAQAFRAALKSVRAAPAAGPAVQAAAPAPQPPVMAPPPAKPASRRGLWMALGAVAAIAVIVIAATQLPQWRRTQAGESTSVAPQEVTAPPQPSEPQPSAQPPAAQETPAAAVQPPKAASRPPAPAPVERPAETPTSKPPADTPAPAREAPPEPAPSAAAQAAAQAELGELRERLISLAARANALRSSLENLEAQQRRAGLGLRTDVATSWRRMEAFMDEAEGAAKARDAAGLRRNLDLAEREADRLDQFLGR